MTIYKNHLLFTGFHLITMQPGGEPYGLIRDGALEVKDGRIKRIGQAAAFNTATFPGEVIHGAGQFLSPGLIDCHTHLVWGGSRVDEWEMRLQGVSYEEIARQGGGILSTVEATRKASADDLYASARARVEALMQQGVTTVEIKSGYGLDLETESKMLDVATRLRDTLPIDIQRTFLGAHALPKAYRGMPDGGDRYIDLVCNEMLPAVKDRCEAVDVFCEGIGFTLAQTRRVFEASRRHSLDRKVHAEQLSLLGGAKLAAEFGALSADHLEYIDEDSVEAMAAQGTVAVLLPGAFYFIQETQKPPVDLFRKHGVPIAIATDANPGSSPATHLPLMMNMACTLFRMTPEEAFRGVTQHAAQALGLGESLGTLDVGKQADLAVWEMDTPASLAYGIGHNPCRAVYKRGALIVDR